MSTTTGSASSVPEHGSGTWRLDPARSSVEFHVRHFYGLMTVKGAFNRYEGTVTLDSPNRLARSVLTRSRLTIGWIQKSQPMSAALSHPRTWGSLGGERRAGRDGWFRSNTARSSHRRYGPVIRVRAAPLAAWPVAPSVRRLRPSWPWRPAGLTIAGPFVRRSRLRRGRSRRLRRDCGS